MYYIHNYKSLSTTSQYTNMIYYTFITFYGRILLQICSGVHWTPASNSTIIFILSKNFDAKKNTKYRLNTLCSLILILN